MCVPSQRWAAWWLICTGGGATAADASCFGAFRFLAAPGRITHHAECLRLLSSFANRRGWVFKGRCRPLVDPWCPPAACGLPMGCTV